MPDGLQVSHQSSVQECPRCLGEGVLYDARGYEPVGDCDVCGGDGIITPETLATYDELVCAERRRNPIQRWADDASCGECGSAPGETCSPTCGVGGWR